MKNLTIGTKLKQELIKEAYEWLSNIDNIEKSIYYNIIN